MNLVLTIHPIVWFSFLVFAGFVFISLLMALRGPEDRNSLAITSLVGCFLSGVVVQFAGLWMLMPVCMGGGFGLIVTNLSLEVESIRSRVNDVQKTIKKIQDGHTKTLVRAKEMEARSVVKA